MLKLDTTSVACPEAERPATPNGVPSSAKLISPAGVPEVFLRIAVRVIGWPVMTELADALSVNAVLTIGAFTAT